MYNPITFDQHGWMQGEIPAECVEDCSHAGECDEDVKYWAAKLEFQVPREQAIKYLREFGACDDLDTADDTTLAQRVLWIACGDIQDRGD